MVILEQLILEQFLLEQLNMGPLILRGAPVSVSADSGTADSVITDGFSWHCHFMLV